MDRAIGNNGDRFNLLAECCNQFVDLGQRWIRSPFNSVCMYERLQCFKKGMNWHDIAYFFLFSRENIEEYFND